MKLVGANPASHAVGLDKQAGVSNYFIGNDPSKWHTNIANYAKVAYQDVYRGIDLVYHGDQQQLEYDFVVKPGARPPRHPAGVRRRPGEVARRPGQPGAAHLRRRRGRARPGRLPDDQWQSGRPWPAGSCSAAAARWASRSATTTTASRW